MTFVLTDNDCLSEELPCHLIKRLDSLPNNFVLPLGAASEKNDRLAAVLLALIWHDSCWQILMTKRAATLSHHAGQVSFPGGACDKCDAGFIDTALREAQEEIGLASAMVKIVGGLLPVRSKAGFIVQPIVGIIDGVAYSDLVPAPDEVDQIFTLPLAHIGKFDNFVWVHRQTGVEDTNHWTVVHPEYHIWGLSAWVLNDLRGRLENKQSQAE